MIPWLLMGLVGCVDYGFALDPAPLDGGEPLLRVDPQALGFGGVAASETVWQSVQLTSTGTAVVDVLALRLAGDSGFQLDADPTPLSLAPGEHWTLDVGFSPKAPGAQLAVLTVSSTDARDAEVPVTLLGEGLTPYLVITPADHDFGERTTGCEDEVRLTLQNTGNADLLIDDAQHADGSHFRLDDGPSWPLTLVPGGSTSGWVRFLPRSEGLLADVLDVASNDPRGLVSASQTGTGVSAGSGQDTWTVPTDVPVDLLFAIDRSGSMEDDALALAGEFDAFITAIELFATDWQIGVVTQDEGCFNEGILTPARPELSATFQTAVTTGDDREIVNDEALFQLVDAALGRAAPGLCNAGFSRPGTPKHVIVISDEPERSTEHAEAWTWDYWLTAFQDKLPAGSALTLSGVVDVDGCSEGADGYAEAIAATGGVALSICSDTWADHVADLAAATLASVFTFELSALPQAATLQVSVDGAGWTDWRWDEAANTVTVQGLSPGQTVQADYGLYASCD